VLRQEPGRGHAKAPLVKNQIVRVGGRATSGGRDRTGREGSFGQDQNASSIASPAKTLTMPRKRIWPSLICNACSKMRRQEIGLMNGSNPSATSISATALSATSQNATDPNRYFRAGGGAVRAGATGGALGPRIALKKSLLGSTITRSDLLRKLAR